MTINHYQEEIVFTLEFDGENVGYTPIRLVESLKATDILNSEMWVNRGDAPLLLKKILVKLNS